MQNREYIEQLTLSSHNSERTTPACPLSHFLCSVQEGEDEGVVLGRSEMRAISPLREGVSARGIRR